MDDNVRMLAPHELVVEGVFPRVDDPAEVLGKEWNEPANKGVAEHHRSLQPGIRMLERMLGLDSPDLRAFTRDPAFQLPRFSWCPL